MKPPLGQEVVISKLPALAEALGVRFDLREALTNILQDMDVMPDFVLDSDIVDTLAISRGRTPGT